MLSLVFLHFATTTHCIFKFWKIDPPYCTSPYTIIHTSCWCAWRYFPRTARDAFQIKLQTTVHSARFWRAPTESVAWRRLGLLKGVTQTVLRSCSETQSKMLCVAKQVQVNEHTVHCTVGWSDFSFLWNFEKKQVGVVTFGKKNMFS